MTPINIAKDVMENLGIKPLIEPVRGGTDGSKISFMGIPTPNIFAGGETCMAALSLSACKPWKKLSMSFSESSLTNKISNGFQ